MSGKKSTAFLITMGSINQNDSSRAVVEVTDSEKKKLTEVANVLSKVPPDNIIRNECKKIVIDSFLEEKQKNFFVSDRITSKIQGIEPG